jgi:CO dehydrogenase maturation factor
MKIAITGKGGVGKTLVAAGLALSLTKNGYNTIAIDADPTPNLALSLGIPLKEANEIIPISENKILIDSKTDTGYPGIYALNFSVKDIIKNYSIPTPRGVSLLVMGTVKSMGSGCTCAANSVIRSLLQHLVVERDEAIVLDMEAGLEHLGRGTAESVDYMLIVSDANAKSLNTARVISIMAHNFGIPKIMLIGNKIDTNLQKNTIKKYAKDNDLIIAGYIPFDQVVAEAGINGDSLLPMQNSTALRAIDRIRRLIVKQRTVNRSQRKNRERRPTE